MKVYIFTVDDHEDSEIIGVFSTYKAAHMTLFAYIEEMYGEMMETAYDAFGPPEAKEDSMYITCYDDTLSIHWEEVLDEAVLDFYNG